MKFIVHLMALAAAASASQEFGSKSSIEMETLKALHFKTKREMAEKKLKLNSAKSLRFFNSPFVQQDVNCDWYNEETCYDEEYNAVSCARYEDGGCPCPEGQEKCGLIHGSYPYCAGLCCESYEETCFDDEFNAVSCASIADGGCDCPDGQVKCGADETWAGYCSAVCCGYDEETCYDAQYNPISCSPIADGGCDCPDGQVKCGGNETIGYLGYCIGICCEAGEETCYDDEGYNAISCASIGDGGCSCPDGLVKCGANETMGWAGYCTDICCEAGEETCYDDEGYNAVSCASVADGGCDCPDGQDKCGADETWAGYCSALCCGNDEETCYDAQYNPVSCSPIAEGGCNCPDGQVKCGVNETMGWLGYCTEICCEDDQELCYDSSNSWFPKPDSCAQIADGGCPCPEGQEKCAADPSINYPGYCTSLCCEEQTCYDYTTWTPTSCVGWADICPSDFMYYIQKAKSVKFMERNGMTSVVSKLRDIYAKKAVLLAKGVMDQKLVEQAIKAEEVAILRKGDLYSGRVLDKNVPSFMVKSY